MIAPKRYRDRRHAGAVLAACLLEQKLGDDLIVLALPRGGVPIGSLVADALRAPLDVFLVRKLGLPSQPELAMGALASGGLRLLDRHLIAERGISEAELQRVTVREQAELDRRDEFYRLGLPPLDVRGRAVVVVDDGLATGFSLRAAVEALRRLRCDSICAAIPVGAEDTCAQLSRVVDELVCPLQPRVFRAVGEWYDDFEATEDAEVVDGLNRNREQFVAVGGYRR